MFACPSFDKNGEKILTRMDGINADMLMDITAYKFKKDQQKTFGDENKEFAVLLIEGKIELEFDGRKEICRRDNCLKDGAYCLHVCKGKYFTVKSLLDGSEFMVQSTTNDRVFDTVFYKPEDMQHSISCEGLWENTAVRDVMTVFDLTNAPYSNMVLGEVYARQGRWWSYIPHSHPQPEVYYYKFLRPEGFGACWVGEDVYTVKDGSYACFPGGNNHHQVTAPGYPLYNIWMIRHLDGDPWDKTRIVDKRYEHLLNE